MTATQAVAFQFKSFASFPMRHGMSGRDLASPFQGEVGHSPAADPASVERNRAAFLAALGISVEALTIARQTHSTTVRRVFGSDRGRGLFPLFDGFPSTDGMMTDDPNVAIGVIVADCVPLLLYDPVNHAVAVVHAGWRGTVGLIASHAIQEMTSSFGSRPEAIRAGIGPSIGPCCYEVGNEVLDAWSSSSGAWGHSATSQVSSAYHFDLWAANRLALMHDGVPVQNIETSATCVNCLSDRYFSYRASRSRGIQHGRMLMVVQLDDIA